MRVLLVNNHCISDPTAGAVHSLRTIARWLVEGGHDCRVLTTARFEAPVTFTISQHLDTLGVPIERKMSPRRSSKPGKPRPPIPPPVARFILHGVPVTMLLTQHNDEQYPDPEESRQYLRLFSQMLDEFKPHQVIGCNSHPMIRRALELAQQHGAITVFALRGYGYYDRRCFEHVNHVFSCSRLVSDIHHEKIGLVSTPIDPPIDWSQVVADGQSRAFLTFVNPSVHKGAMLFARLAQMLGDQRPDIPIMVVQSGHTAAALNKIPGIDFTKYPQIMAAPPVPKPADYFALTRMILVPSVWEEPFGRVAAEAMINGIPTLVGDRGSLPDVVGGDFSQGGGGCVLPIPPWMDPMVPKLPTADEIQPWFDAVCRIWDDPGLYASISARAQAIAAERYSEAESRRRHVDYLVSLRPGARPFDDAAAELEPNTPS